VVYSRTRLIAVPRLGVALWGDGERLFLSGSESAALWEGLPLRALCSQARPVHGHVRVRALCLDRLFLDRLFLDRPFLLVQQVPVDPALAPPRAAGGPRPGGSRSGFGDEAVAGERRCSLGLVQQVRLPHWLPTCCTRLGVDGSSLYDPTRLSCSGSEYRR
jgi:hypothetical protein